MYIFAVMQCVNFSDSYDIYQLDGENYKIWEERVIFHLGCSNIDHAIRKDEPHIVEIFTQTEIVLHDQWERSTYLSVLFT